MMIPPEPLQNRLLRLLKLQSEAEELAKLSAGIPMQVTLVTRGQLPKNLGDQLKRIEKLPKHLRSEWREITSRI